MKYFKKTILISLILLIIGTISPTCIYANTDYSQYKTIADTVVKVQEIPIELYNLNNEIVALYYKAIDKGYVIINIKDKRIPEFSDESNNKYISETKKNYYNGALTYLEQGSQNEIIDSKTLETINTNLNPKDIYGTTENIAATNLKTKTITKKSILDQSFGNVASSSKTISGTVPNYSYNPDGRCGATASAMMLRYLDINYNGKIVPTKYHNDEINFIKKLTNYIPVDSSAYNVYGGIESFENDYGVSNLYLSIEYAQIGQIVSAVNANKPFVLGLLHHPDYGNHWVCGYGYYIGQNDYARVNDGWGSTGVDINLAYCDQLIRN
jgi:hypothetical protein